ncbi:unnamed protein product [Lactuca saligna]|uniref:Uncharacterized protein n=1 Tax=Lactuca saligna TaxID=75948 RepID=A0AA36E121_LACSI|nr:unnamed protein product [Lactuca saligna]
MLQSTGNIKELMEAKALLGAMKSEQARLVEELQYIHQEDDRLVETLNNTNNAQTHESHNLENQNMSPVTDDSMMDLQARLDNVVKAEYRAEAKGNSFGVSIGYSGLNFVLYISSATP